MAATPENATSHMSTDSVLLNDDDDDIKYGFRRPDMYTQRLYGTVLQYERHVLLVYKSHKEWPPHLESSELDPLPKRLADVFEDREDAMRVKSMLTICEGSDITGLTDGDVLIFPDKIKYRGLEESNIDSFVEEVLVNGRPWGFAKAELVTGSYVFVCAHTSRDKRSGVCGPALIKKFNEEIEVKGLKDQVFVNPCSYIPGNLFAGNLIIFNAVVDGIVSGHWYGYVTPNDVPELLEQHIKKGEIVKRIWRGQMRIPRVENTEKIVIQSLPKGNDTKASETYNISSITSEKENVGGYCLGANGFFTRIWEQLEIFIAGVVVGAAVATLAIYGL